MNQAMDIWRGTSKCKNCRIRTEVRFEMFNEVYSLNHFFPELNVTVDTETHHHQCI